MTAPASSRSRTAFIAVVAGLVAAGTAAGLALGFGGGAVVHSAAPHHATPTHHAASPAVPARPNP